MARLIDADAYSAEMKDRQEAAWKWRNEAIAEEDEVKLARAEGAFTAFTEAKLTMDKHIISPWHRVEDELPSMDGYDWVLGIVTGEAGYHRFHKAVMMVSFDPQYKEWFIDEYPDAKITVSHWMELPEAPKEKEDDTAGT